MKKSLYKNKLHIRNIIKVTKEILTCAVLIILITNLSYTKTITSSGKEYIKYHFFLEYKKTVQNKESNLEKSDGIKIAYPIDDNQEVINDFFKREAGTIQQNNDEKKENRIVNLYQPDGSDYHLLKLEIKEENSSIEIDVFNLLGKKVLHVDDGPPKTNFPEYKIESFRLPNGVYICVVSGKNFKLIRKFIVAR